MGLFIDPAHRETYTPKDERVHAEGKRITFEVGVMSAGEYAAVQNAGILPGGVRRGTHIVALLRYGLKGINVPAGRDGPAWDTDRDGYPTDAFLDRLTGALRIELADVIDDLNTIGPAEGKASAS